MTTLALDSPPSLGGRLVNALTRPEATPMLAKAIYLRALALAVRQNRLALAAALINARHGRPGFFSLTLVDGAPELFGEVGIVFRGGRCRLYVNRHVPGSPRIAYWARRLDATLPLFAACRDMEDGQTSVGIDDVSLAPGLAFSDWRPDRFLVPDAIFLGEQAYRRVARHYAEHAVPWDERRPVAFWRGTTTGRCAPGEWRTLDRVRLCELGAAHPDLFDVGISDVVQLNEADTAAVRASSLMRPFVPDTEFIRYRWQIDIDGNSNAWPGMFLKLLSGSPVLKVASRGGYRQWYYDRLVPGVNFVPVATDLSDLVEKVRWLKANAAEARRIGTAGRALALSMTVPAELQRAQPTIRAALRQGGEQ